MDHADFAMGLDYLRNMRTGGRPSADLQSAWDRFYRSADSLLRSQIARQGLSGSEEDDCAQAVWADLVDRCPDGRAMRQPRAWLSCLARNKAADYHRRVSRRRTVPIVDDLQCRGGPGTLPASDEARRVIWECLRRLEARVSPLNSLIFYLKWIEGFPIQEIASIVSMEPTRVRLRHQRTKRVFRNLLLEAIEAPSP